MKNRILLWSLSLCLSFVNIYAEGENIDNKEIQNKVVVETANRIVILWQLYQTYPLMTDVSSLDSSLDASLQENLVFYVTDNLLEQIANDYNFWNLLIEEKISLLSKDDQNKIKKTVDLLLKEKTGLDSGFSAKDKFLSAYGDLGTVKGYLSNYILSEVVKGSNYSLFKNERQLLLKEVIGMVHLMQKVHHEIKNVAVRGQAVIDPLQEYLCMNIERMLLVVDIYKLKNKFNVGTTSKGEETIDFTPTLSRLEKSKNISDIYLGKRGDQLQVMECPFYKNNQAKMDLSINYKIKLLDDIKDEVKRKRQDTDLLTKVSPRNLQVKQFLQTLGFQKDLFFDDAIQAKEQLGEDIKKGVDFSKGSNNSIYENLESILLKNEKLSDIDLKYIDDNLSLLCEDSVIANKAEPFFKDMMSRRESHTNQNCLHKIALTGNEELFSMLSSQKDPSLSILLKEKDSLGRTPLHWATLFNRPEFLQNLMDISDLQTLEQRDGRNYTALDIAVQKENIALVKMLINKGAIVTKSTVAIAVDYGNLELAQYLEQRLPVGRVNEPIPSNSSWFAERIKTLFDFFATAELHYRNI